MYESSTIDTIFRVLSHSNRRFALDCVRKHGSMTVADLADEVAVRVHGRPIDQIAEEEVTRVLLGLHHTHIPMLAAADMVTYDRSTGTVAIGPAAEQAAPFLSLAEDKARKLA